MSPNFSLETTAFPHFWSLSWYFMNYARKRAPDFFHTLVNLIIQSDWVGLLTRLSSEMIFFLLSHLNVEMFCSETLLDVNYLLLNGIIIVLFCRQWGIHVTMNLFSSRSLYMLAGNSSWTTDARLNLCRCHADLKLMCSDMLWISEDVLTILTQILSKLTKIS